MCISKPPDQLDVGRADPSEPRECRALPEAVPSIGGKACIMCWTTRLSSCIKNK